MTQILLKFTEAPMVENYPVHYTADRGKRLCNIKVALS